MFTVFCSSLTSTTTWETHLFWNSIVVDFVSVLRSLKHYGCLVGHTTVCAWSNTSGICTSHCSANSCSCTLWTVTLISAYLRSLMLSGYLGDVAGSTPWAPRGLPPLWGEGETENHYRAQRSMWCFNGTSEVWRAEHGIWQDIKTIFKQYLWDIFYSRSNCDICNFTTAMSK